VLPSKGWLTRFAPAPTGYLHLGHVVNAVYVWGIARAFGGRVMLRVEDHDRTRCRPEYEAALLDDLDWLGFVPDVGPSQSYRELPTQHPLRQSDNGARYLTALKSLDAQHVVYTCECSRRDIQQRAPRPTGEELHYSGRCRERAVDPASTLARRVVMTSGDEAFDDVRLGPFAHVPSEQCGDVLVRDRHGGWTYQFAVSVDDTVQGIDLIIRGEDLLASTARQRRLARLLGNTRLPQVLHHPLLVHPDGSKLSKANQDSAIADRRAAGERPEVLLGHVADLLGLRMTTGAVRPDDFAELLLGA